MGNNCPSRSKDEIKVKLRSYLLLAMFCVAGCKENTDSLPAGNENSLATNATETDKPDETQSFGDFSFSIPKGWTSVPPDREKTKAMLLLDGTDAQNAKAMIKIDVGMPAAPTARQLAESFAKSVGGNVSSDALNFDGEDAVIATTSSNDLGTPRNMIIVYRDAKAYLLMAGATEGVDIGDAVSHIRSSWKWKQATK